MLQSLQYVVLESLQVATSAVNSVDRDLVLLCLRYSVVHLLVFEAV